MKSLKDLLADPQVSQAVVNDALHLLDEEVAKRSGIGGMAIKAAYKLIKNVQGGRALEKAVRVLIPEFIEKVDPYYTRFQEEGQGKTLEAYLRPHYDTIADELLSVTDRKVQGTDNRAVRGAYEKLRPKGRKEVVASLPALIRMMKRYL
jgi:hypothetical protein